MYLNQRRLFVDIMVDGNEQERSLHFENILPVAAHSPSGARGQEIKQRPLHFCLSENNHFFKE